MRSIALFAIVLNACTGAPAPPAPVVPTPSLKPSMVQTVWEPGTRAELDVTALADVARCAECHPDAADQWRNSPHGRSSFDNPWYRFAVDAFVEDRGARASRFCAGCHDPVLLLSGKIDATVEPNDPDATAGITCMVCHSIREPGAQGNASYSLTSESVLFPDPAEPAEIEEHRVRIGARALRTSDMCGSCHRSFVGPDIGSPNHFAGIDDLGAWRESVYAGSLSARVDAPTEVMSCQGCHMKPETAVHGDQAADSGLIASHRWAASHTTMAAQVGDPTRIETTRASLRSAARIDVPHVVIGRASSLAGKRLRVKPGAPLALTVAIVNEATGHRFPGGTRDLQNTWVEVIVRDGAGRALLQSGVGRSEGAFGLRSIILDHQNAPEPLHFVHRFSVPAFDKTIGARDVGLVRYEGVLPKRVIGQKLTIEARLLHTKHNRAFELAACEADKGDRSDTFRQTAQHQEKIALSACDLGPTTELAKATVRIGRRADSEQPPSVRAQRLYDYGRGLLRDVQERVLRAKPVLDEAREEFVRGADSTGAARVDALLARMYGQTQQIALMERHLARAREVLGDHVALDRIAGDGYAAAWAWDKALGAYTQVKRGAPLATSTWVNIARAAGSLGQDAVAAEAARHGLRLSPNHAALWRSLSLATRGAEHDEAIQAWQRYKHPDSRPASLAQCENHHLECKKSRPPIPTYPLVSP